MKIAEVEVMASEQAVKMLITMKMITPLRHKKPSIEFYLDFESTFAYR